MRQSFNCIRYFSLDTSRIRDQSVLLKRSDYIEPETGNMDADEEDILEGMRLKQSIAENMPDPIRKIYLRKPALDFSSDSEAAA